MESNYSEAIGSSSVMSGICKDFILAAQNQFTDGSWTEERANEWLGHVKHLIDTQEEWIGK